MEGAWILRPPHVVKPPEQGVFSGCSVIRSQMSLCRAMEMEHLLVKGASVQSSLWRLAPPFPFLAPRPLLGLQVP